jgi:hypothetical protein
LNRTLSIALAIAMAVPVLAAHEGSASADRRVRVRGNARAHVRVRAPRARIRIRRGPARYRVGRSYRGYRNYRYRPYRYRYYSSPRYQLYVGGGFSYGWRYASPPPACYHECGPSTQVRGYYRPAAAAPVQVVSQPAPLPRLGIGLFAGGMNVEDREATSDVGLIGRFRLTDSFLIEGEIAKSELEDGDRVDRRLGAALVWDLSPRSRLSPQLMIGGGAVRADIDDNGNSLNADQMYGEIGVGLAWRLSRSLELSADVRAGSREVLDNGNDAVFATTSPIQEEENYTRGRIAAMLFF